MSTITPIRDSILFTFLKNFTMRNGTRMFRETTATGLIVDNFDAGASEPQWGIVLEVGPEVSKDIKQGTKILIDTLKWTEEHKLSGMSFWRTTDEHVLAIEDNENGVEVGIK
jgi:hypothetical protein